MDHSHDHDNHTVDWEMINSTDWALPFTEMQLMWGLMALMAVHHVWMWRKMRTKAK